MTSTAVRDTCGLLELAGFLLMTELHTSHMSNVTSRVANPLQPIGHILQEDIRVSCATTLLLIGKDVLQTDWRSMPKGTKKTPPQGTETRHFGEFLFVVYLKWCHPKMSR